MSSECVKRSGWRRLASGACWALAIICVGLGAWGVWKSGGPGGGTLPGSGTRLVVFLPENADCDGTKVCEPGKCSPDTSSQGFWYNGVPVKLISPVEVGQLRGLKWVHNAYSCLLLRMFNPADSQPYLIVGVDLDNPEAVQACTATEKDVVAGRFLKNGERKAALLEESYAGSRGLKVGSTIEIAETKFTVAGIVKTDVRPARGDVYLTMPDARDAAYSRMYDPPDMLCTMMLLELKDAQSQRPAMQQVKELTPGAAVLPF